MAEKRWGTVFILTAGMAPDGTFYAEDDAGFLHGEIRIEAAKALWELKQVDRFKVVGPKETGQGMTKLLLDSGIPEVSWLESPVNTMGHIEPIMAHAHPGDGVLTQFYHQVRFWVMAGGPLAGVESITAESVLLEYDFEEWMPIFKEHYSSPEMAKRILSEMTGIGHLMSGGYKSRQA